jgi:hypothetical protein
MALPLCSLRVPARFGTAGKQGSVLMLKFLFGTVQTKHAPVAERGCLLLAQTGPPGPVLRCPLWMAPALQGLN